MMKIVILYVAGGGATDVCEAKCMGAVNERHHPSVPNKGVGPLLHSVIYLSEIGSCDIRHISQLPVI